MRSLPLKRKKPREEPGSLGGHPSSCGMGDLLLPRPTGPAGGKPSIFSFTTCRTTTGRESAALLLLLPAHDFLLEPDILSAVFVGLVPPLPDRPTSKNRHTNCLWAHHVGKEAKFKQHQSLYDAYLIWCILAHGLKASYKSLAGRDVWSH